MVNFVNRRKFIAALAGCCFIRLGNDSDKRLEKLPELKRDFFAVNMKPMDDEKYILDEVIINHISTAMGIPPFLLTTKNSMRVGGKG